MIVSERLYTAQEFWELSAEPDHNHRHELVRGKFIETPLTGGVHGATVATIAGLLSLFVQRRAEGRILIDAGFILQNDPDVVRGPDVAFIAAERLPDPLPDGWLPFAPDVAVEVVSPHDRTEDIQEKIEEYLRAGTRVVWVFYPKTRVVNVHQGSATLRLTDTDTLEGGDLLPGFSSPVREFFP